MIKKSKLSYFCLRFRTEKIQSIVDSNGDDAPIVLYRLGQYIDLSLGPHISSTSLMYHYVVVAVSKFYLFLSFRFSHLLCFAVSQVEM